jgi:hypothetical protein
LKAWFRRIVTAGLFGALAFGAGYFYRPIGTVSQVQQVIETAKDGVKKVTTTTTKQPIYPTPSGNAVSDVYRPNYTAGIFRGWSEEFRIEGGYRILGNLWLMGAYSSFKDISVGVRIDF